MSKPVDILLVDDNPGDVRLTLEAFKDARIRNRVHVARDGVEALQALRGESPFEDIPRPDIVLLDLNMPRMDGRQVLAEVKADADLRAIPVIVLTTSAHRDDVANTYAHHANCFITKPVDFSSFVDVLTTLENFWFSIVRLPQ